MRILIVGAGATGGAFGTLLQEAGRDVTYLVRENRAAVLRRDGLRFVSPDGARTHTVATITTADSAQPFDLVILAVKATALDQAIVDLAHFVGPNTRILPILNGMPTWTEWPKRSRARPWARWCTLWQPWTATPYAS